MNWNNQEDPSQMRANIDLLEDLDEDIDDDDKKKNKRKATSMDKEQAAAGYSTQQKGQKKDMIR